MITNLTADVKSFEKNADKISIYNKIRKNRKNKMKIHRNLLKNQIE